MVQHNERWQEDEVKMKQLLLYSIIVYNKPYLIQKDDITLRELKPDDYFTAFSILKKADYLVTKNPVPVESYVAGTREVALIEKFASLFHNPNKIPGVYTLVKTIAIPLDRSHLFIYKKTRDMKNEEWSAIAHELENIDTGNGQKIRSDLYRFLSLGNK